MGRGKLLPLRIPHLVVCFCESGKDLIFFPGVKNFISSSAHMMGIQPSGLNI